MKQGRNTSIIVNNEFKAVAINLGADFYWEHEHGIQPLQEILGVENRKITKGFDLIATNLRTKTDNYKFGGESIKLWGLSVNFTDDMKHWKRLMRYGYYNREKESVYSFWDNKSLFFMVEDKKIIEDFYAAFKTNDIKIWLGNLGAFNNEGLIIAIDSKTTNF